MIKEFELLVDIYANPDKTGKQRLIAKDSKILRQLNTEDLEIAQYINNNGKISKKHTLLIDKRYSNTTYKLNMPYNKAKDYLKEKEIFIKGYRRYQ